MENKLSELQTFLNLYNQLFNFPLTLYTFEKGFFFSTLELDDIAKDFLSYQQKYVEPLIDENECVNIFTEDFFLTALMKIQDSKLYLLIGPVKLDILTEGQITKLMERYHVPNIYRPSIEFIIENIPVKEHSVFLKNVVIINYAINRCQCSANKLLESETIEKKEDSNDYIPILENYFDEEARHVGGEFEEKLIFIIKNGLVDELHEISYGNAKGRIGILGDTYLRNIKNQLIILNSLCLRAAISGGMDRETACTVGEKYAREIEKCKTVNELSSLSTKIKYDYCSRVKAIIEPEINNPLILKAIIYIKNNKYNYIQAKDIANDLGVTPEYFSALFKKYTGKTFSEYYNSLRIQEAKKLLIFTDKSLVEIAMLLNFSSQSHFQNQFKKVIGTTPTEYRNMRKTG